MERLTQRQICLEWLKCYFDVRYFTLRYGWLYNATEQAWLPFYLWPAQARALRQMACERLLVILKARQLGISWLALAYALWVLIFQAPATVLLFSLREAEAVELLARLKEMYRRLPPWMRARKVVRENETTLLLSNGSRALAFSTRAGRSYTGTLALVDEADFVPDLGNFLNGVKPTIDAGGKLFLVSTSDKRRPLSPFKNLFRAASRSAPEGANASRSAPEGADGVPGVGDYRALFLPWHSHPGRNAAWRARTKAEMFAQRGTHDDFYAEYPETAEEALAPEELDRRIPYGWIKRVMEATPPLTPPQFGEGNKVTSPLPPGQVGEGDGEMRGVPAIPGLTLYVEAVAGRRYVMGVDPAEGNPNSDDSAATVLDAEEWAEVATLAGKFEPAVFAAFVELLGRYFNQADAMVERNNHGHTVIRALTEKGRTRLLKGYDGKVGWLSNVKGKPLLYDALAEAVRDGVCKVRSPETASQLASIEASSLRAPQGLADDRADAFALAVAALAYRFGGGEGSLALTPVDALAGVDGDGF